MFVVLCIVCLYFSGLTVPYVMYELFGRLSRNAFIVLALILFAIILVVTLFNNKVIKKHVHY